MKVLFFNHEDEFTKKWTEHSDKLAYVRMCIQSRKYSKADKLLSFMERSSSLKRWISKHLHSDSWNDTDLSLAYTLAITLIIGWAAHRAVRLYRFKHLPQV